MPKIYRIEYFQFIPAGMERCWEFFSSPANLKKITPPGMGFDIISGGDEPMFPGQIIVYKVQPFPRIPVTWVTEITQVEPFHYFIDEQRFGPYRFWHHLHRFRETGQGVEMTDIIHFSIPFGWFGKLALPLIRRQLRRIFDYRKEQTEQLFGRF